MNYLFLDMDGVLNSTQSAHYFWRTKHGRKTFMEGFEELCPIACSNLDYLLEGFPDTKVVISSTWRLFHEIDEWNTKMKDVCPSIVGRVIGKTPRIGRLSEGVQRGEEIRAWLDENALSTETFVIFDDDSDMDAVREGFIKTDPNLGLTWNDIMKVFTRFGVRP